MASSLKGALQLLSAYDSSENESEDEIPGPKVSVKRTLDTESLEPNSQKRHAGINVQNRLPPPLALSKLFQSNCIEDQPKDLPEEHEGRLRTFAHERGNWATYVYIAVDSSQALESFRDVIITTLDTSLNVQVADNLHISLTKTVILKHHWIDLFALSVQSIAQVHSRFPLCFGELKVYCNEERTRTFIGLLVTAGQEHLLKITHQLDKSLADFKLPPFYEEASFHMSIAWCVGDHANKINMELPRLQSSLNLFIHSQPMEWSINVEKLHFRTGNKYFSFALAV